MFSILPPLLSFSSLAPLLLRITLGLVFIFWSIKKFKNEKVVSILEGIIGATLFIGFATQLVALIAAIILGYKLVRKILAKSFFTDGVNYYFILFIISISLIVTGAGFVAFDLPL